MEEIIKDIEEHLRSIGLTPMSHRTYPADGVMNFISFTTKDVDDNYQTLIAGVNAELGSFTLYAHLE